MSRLSGMGLKMGWYRRWCMADLLDRCSRRPWHL